MKKKISFLLLLSVLCSNAQSTIQWQKSLGGTNLEYSYSVIQTPDGGSISAGGSMSNDGDMIGNHGGLDAAIVKLNSSGNIEWQKSYGGTGSDHAYSIVNTSDGGYIFAGTSSSNDGDVTGNHGFSDFWVVKLTSSGSIDWQRSFGGSEFDHAYSIQQTTDGGYVVAGDTSSNNGNVTLNHGAYDYWVLKISDIGTLEWQKTFGGASQDTAYSVKQTAEGGYILAGIGQGNSGDITGNQGVWDYWVVKINNLGVMEWQKSFGGTNSDYACEIIQTSDGGYIVTGFTGSTDGDITNAHGSDAWVVKLSTNGTIEWQKALGGSGGDFLYFIRQTPDGGYIAVGDTTSNDFDVSGHHGDPILTLDCWIVKLNSTGNIQWQKSIGGTNDDTGVSIINTSDGNYILTGYSSSNDNDVSGNHGSIDWWTVKLDNNLGVKKSVISNPIVVYPNPAKNEINVKANSIFSSYIIYDESGKVVLSGTSNAENFIIKTDDFPKGIYTIEVQNNDKSSCQKIIKN